MGYWTDYGAWQKRRRKLLGEEQERALVRDARRVSEAFAAAEPDPGDMVEVRWGLAKDATGIAELLELNGLPRWVAFEERFVVAEERGRITAAVRYRMVDDDVRLRLQRADARGLARRGTPNL